MLRTDNAFFKMLARALMAAFLVGSLGMVSACDEQGPAETAGEEIDETMEEAGEAMEEAGDEMEDSTN